MARRQPRIAAVLAAAALAGCGGTGKPDMTPRKSEAVTKAVEAARGQTLQVRISRSGRIPEEGEYSFEGEGSVRGDGSRGVVRGNLVALDGSEMDAEVRFAGTDTWVAAPQLELPDGARWIRSGKVLVLDRAIAPWNLLDIMAAAYDVSRGGGKEVDGEPADHYRGVADVSVLRETVPELAIGGDPRERVPLEIWIADGRPKRLLMDFKSREADFRYDAVVTGYDDAEIPAPPPARASVDAEDLTR